MFPLMFSAQNFSLFYITVVLHCVCMVHSLRECWAPWSCCGFTASAEGLEKRRVKLKAGPPVLLLLEVIFYQLWWLTVYQSSFMSLHNSCFLNPPTEYFICFYHLAELFVGVRVTNLLEDLVKTAGTSTGWSLYCNAQKKTQHMVT